MGEFISSSTGSKAAVIIFVHGLFGDSRSTWTNENGTYWPDLLREDPTFKNENIYTFEYSSPKFGLSYTIDELADVMNREFENDGIQNYSKLIFLCHSMGGVVTRAFLLKYREKYADKVRFAYFFSTPSTGSSIATIVSIISKNPQLGKIRPMQSGDYLADIHRGWLNTGLTSKISSYCAYEIKKTYGQQIVEMESATALCNKKCNAILKNHFDIVKPANLQDESHHAFRAAYIEETAVDHVPKVISTSPSNGEILPVLPEGSVIYISVEYDVPMAKGCSWCEIPGKNHPKVIDHPAWSSDRRTCMQRRIVYPEKEYVISFNLKGVAGKFKSENDIPAEPYLLSFETKLQDEHLGGCTTNMA